MTEDKPQEVTQSEGGSSESPAADFTPGSTIGRYRLVALLAQGGMAEVLLAQTTGPGGFSKVSAMKRVLPNIAKNEECVQMFLHEARIAAKLEHPNIVRIYDLGEESGTYYLSMEYLPGEDLHGVLKRCSKLGGRIPLELALMIAHQAAHGLDFAHQLTDAEGVCLGLVHRDVSPSNIFLTFHGEVKLVDFGIAKATNAAGLTGDNHVLKGKLSYLSPELIRGDALDGRADIFGLGIVLWEMLAGRPLFTRDVAAATISAVSTCQVPPLGPLNPEVDATLEAVIRRALSPDREARFQTAGEFAEALEGCMAERGVSSNARSLSRWLEDLFGSTRAEAKRAIARGAEVTRNLPIALRPPPPATAVPKPQLRQSGSWPAPQQPRPSTPVPIDAFEPLLLTDSAVKVEKKPNTWLGPFALSAVMAVPIVLSLLASTPGALPLLDTLPARKIVEVKVESRVPGALVFLEGEPTGKRTPAVLAIAENRLPLTVQVWANSRLVGKSLDHVAANEVIRLDGER